MGSFGGYWGLVLMGTLRDGIALRIILSKGREARALIYQLTFLGQRSLLGINSASSPTCPKPRLTKLLLVKNAYRWGDARSHWHRWRMSARSLG